MKRFYTYRWFEFNLNVACTKCGNNIVFQDFNGNPTCEECGNTNKFRWIDVLKWVGTKEITNRRKDAVRLSNQFKANSNSNPVKKIACYHCHTPLHLTDETDVKNYNCGSCNNQVLFREYPELEDLVFYRSGKPKENTTQDIQPIAIRCSSCGAPLHVDPTKNNFTCEHCNTDNILPISMRYKVVLADIYVGERKTRYPKPLAFEQDGQTVKLALRENGKKGFTEAELDQILINKKDDMGVYKLIVNEFNHVPSNKILQELFATSTNQSIIDLTGKLLQKQKDEVDERIKQVSPLYKDQKPISEKSAYKKESDEKTKKTSPFKVIVWILFWVIVATGFYFLIIKN